MDMFDSATMIAIAETDGVTPRVVVRDRKSTKALNWRKAESDQRACERAANQEDGRTNPGFGRSEVEELQSGESLPPTVRIDCSLF